MKVKFLAAVVLLFPLLLHAEARKVGDYQWEGVERIVAIGDVHGDYGNYMKTLESAGLVDRKGKWAAGNTHFVQLGDLPDRGPDTLMIIEHIRALAKQAKRKGGRVHSLIGNHESMNVTGDLRYVHPGEYEAFNGRKSKALRDRYFKLYMERIEQQAPERYAALPENFRAQWEEEHPLGWLEHRQAWDLAWNRDAELAEWVMDQKVAVRVNDNVFVHGGISASYCANSLASLTERVVEQLAAYDPSVPGILEDPNGPLWYRGLSGVAPEAAPETVDAILEHHGISRIVVGHTPTMGVIWPEYDAKVIVADTGISSYYGGYVAYLEITSEGAFAGYPSGKLALPTNEADTVAYLEQVIAMDPENPYLKKRLQQLTQPAAVEPDSSTGEAGDEVAEEETDELICGTS